MKKILFGVFAALILAAYVSISGCKKDDTTAPVISISGNNPATVVINSSYTDAGATANDEEDGTVSVSTTGSVDVTTEGSYSIDYSASDAAGNLAAASRTVNVVIVRDSYVGTYNVTGTLDNGGGPVTETPYGTPIVASTTQSDRIIISNFAGQAGSNAYCTVSGHTVTIPTQPITAFSLSLTLQGNGTMNNKAEIMSLTWTATDGTTTVTGVETYTKQ